VRRTRLKFSKVSLLPNVLEKKIRELTFGEFLEFLPGFSMQLRPSQQSHTDTDTYTDTDTDTNTVTDTVTDTDTDIDIDTDADADIVTGTDTDTDKDTNIDTETHDLYLDLQFDCLAS